MSSFHSAKQQQGIALIIGMVVLIVLAALAVTALRATAVEERMAGNSYDRHIAFQAAESALRQAEDYLETNTLPVFDGNSGLFLPNESTSDTQRWQTGRWFGINYTGDMDQGSASYIIERLDKTGRLAGGTSLAADAVIEANRFYRITAYGSGPSGDSRVLLQVMYER
jgi:type IV pilus assembly protein PilX